MANTQINIVTNGVTTLATAGKYCDRNIDVNVEVPASGITPTGSINITVNGTHNVANYANAVVNVPTGITPSGTKTITENGTHDVTNYASAVVNVPTAQPTQFTNLYSINNVTVKSNLSSTQTKNTAISMETYNYGNVLKIPYSHAANGPVVLRMRGIGTVRDRFQCVITDASDLVVSWGQLSAANVLAYDEYGDACLTLSNPFLNYSWEYLYIVFQYPGKNSGVATAYTGPIVTINEPIGNGGYVG